jgi:omega-hydroxy-beta-dihydromenaquinone-9 sulfotransferase
LVPVSLSFVQFFFHLTDSSGEPIQRSLGEPAAREVSASPHATKPAKKNDADFHHYPFYSPRFWHGMLPLTWLRLLKSGKFRVHPSRLPLAIGVTLTTPLTLMLSLLQRVVFRGRLAEAELHGPPVFIVGHWRSGTTLLHELMVRDERLSSPSTFQCFAPAHFLVSEWFFRRFASWLLPGKRPMDNMAAGWDRPQEDEFALLTLGLPSPYRRIAFPNEAPVDLQYLDFVGVSEAETRVWLDSLRKFLLTVSVATRRPLIIKSPTHTGRIELLAKEFPDAKFIHITRDPRSLFPSTCRLWRGLDEVQGLQKPDHRQIEGYVVECLRRMYVAFHAQREQVEPHRLIDVRYEDLVADPVGTLDRIYSTLKLGDFDAVRPTLEAWVKSEHRDYQRNQHRLPREQETLIADAWQEYFQRYGYESS